MIREEENERNKPEDNVGLLLEKLKNEINILINNLSTSEKIIDDRAGGYLDILEKLLVSCDNLKAQIESKINEARELQRQFSHVKERINKPGSDNDPDISGLN